MPFFKEPCLGGASQNVMSMFPFALEPVEGFFFPSFRGLRREGVSLDVLRVNGEGCEREKVRA